MEALRKYTLVRGQPSQNRVFLICYTNSVFLHSLKLVASSSYGHLSCVLRVSIHESSIVVGLSRVIICDIRSREHP